MTRLASPFFLINKLERKHFFFKTSLSTRVTRSSQSPPHMSSGKLQSQKMSSAATSRRLRPNQSRSRPHRRSWSWSQSRRRRNRHAGTTPRVKKSVKTLKLSRDAAVVRGGGTPRHKDHARRRHTGGSQRATTSRKPSRVGIALGFGLTLAGARAAYLVYDRKKKGTGSPEPGSPSTTTPPTPTPTPENVSITHVDLTSSADPPVVDLTSDDPPPAPTSTWAYDKHSFESVTLSPFWINATVMTAVSDLCGALVTRNVALIRLVTVNYLVDVGREPLAKARAVELRDLVRATRPNQSLENRTRTYGVTPDLRTAKRLCMIRHVDGNHWYVLVADTDTRVYYVLDSLGPRNQAVAPTDARRRLPEVFDMIAAIRGEARYDAANNSPPWTQHVTTNFPRQTNAYDCGVFALCAIALVLSGADPTNLGTCAWIQPGEMTTRRNEVAETYRSGFLWASWRDKTAACAGR